MKRFFAIVLACLVLLNSFCYAMPALSKEETVYINLDEEGNVSEMNIYNKCQNNYLETLEDFTKYETITNLTNREEYVISGEAVSFNISGEKSFAYTGKVSNDYYEKFPWNFKLSYKLNGVEKSIDELVGESGLVEITLECIPNENANDYYKNNFMLELTGSYDMTKYLSLDSDEAMITTIGSTKTLMFIVLPGQSSTLHIRIGTNDFSMDGLTMAVTTLSGNVLDKIVDIIEAKQDLDDIFDTVDNSTDIILSALANMETGVNGISTGIKEIKSGTIKIHNLDTLRDEDIKNMKYLLSEMIPVLENTKNDLNNLKETYTEFMEKAEIFNSKLSKLSNSIDSLNKQLDDLNEMCENLPNVAKKLSDTLETLSKTTGNLKTLLGRLEDSSSSENIESDLKSVKGELQNMGVALATISNSTTDPAILGEVLKISQSLESVGTDLTDLKDTLAEMSSGTSTTAISNNLTDLKKQLSSLSKMLDEDDAEIIENVVYDFSETSNILEEMINSLVDSSELLVNNKEELSVLFIDLASITDELSKASAILNSSLENLQTLFGVISSEFYDGTIKTADSIISVNNQLAKITSQSNTFQNSKTEAKNIIDDKINDVEAKTNIFNLKKDAEIVSFGDERNENVTSVQFILKTPDIKEIKAKNNDMEKEEENLSFLEKVLLILDKLFGWIIRLFA